MKTYHIRLIAGDDYPLIVRWLDSDRVEVPIASARLQVRRIVSEEDVLIDLTSDLTIDGGEITLSMDGARTTEVFDAVGRAPALWDLEATAESSQVKTLVGGRITVNQGISR